MFYKVFIKVVIVLFVGLFVFSLMSNVGGMFGWCLLMVVMWVKCKWVWFSKVL